MKRELIQLYVLLNVVIWKAKKKSQNQLLLGTVDLKRIVTFMFETNLLLYSSVALFFRTVLFKLI